MRVSLALLFVLVAVPIVYGQAAGADAAEMRDVFESFHGSLDTLTKRNESKGPRTARDYQARREIAKTLSQIRASVDFLEALSSNGKPGPKEYWEGVSQDARLLRKLAGPRSETGSQKALLGSLHEVDADLEIKVTGPRGGGDVPRVVEVVVRARRGSQDVGAYQVWYVLKGWANTPSYFKPFDRLTDPANPSSMNLAPGNYFIWLSNGKPVTERQPASIGINGELRKEIDIPVP